MGDSAPQRSSAEVTTFRRGSSVFHNHDVPSRLLRPLPVAKPAPSLFPCNVKLCRLVPCRIVSCRNLQMFIFPVAQVPRTSIRHGTPRAHTRGTEALACMCRPWTPPPTRPRCYLKQLKRPREKRQGPRRTPCRSAVTLVPKCLPPKPFE